MTGNDPEGEHYANNVGSGFTLTMNNQPATSLVDPIVVANTSASALGSKLVVKRALPSTSSPPLTYHIEVFDNSGDTGSPR